MTARRIFLATLVSSALVSGGAAFIACAGEDQRAVVTSSAEDAADDAPSASDGEHDAVVDLRGACLPRDADVSDVVAPESQRFSPDACTIEAAGAIIHCLFGDEADRCGSIDAVSEDCKACATSSADAAKLGAIILEGPFGRLNLAGCLENVVPGTLAADCAAAIARAEACASVACDDCFRTGITADDYDSCRARAFLSTCAAYAKERADCRQSFLAADAAAGICAPVRSFRDHALELVMGYCGGRFADAGTD